MAQVVTTKILDGARNVVVHISIVGSGLGDVTDETVIDPADLGLSSVPALTIDRLTYDLTGFDARLEFDYLASDTPLWSMSGGQAVQLDFCQFGGLTDRSPVLDGTGKLLLTTSGLGNGDVGTIVIQARK